MFPIWLEIKCMHFMYYTSFLLTNTESKKKQDLFIDIIPWEVGETGALFKKEKINFYLPRRFFFCLLVNFSFFWTLLRLLRLVLVDLIGVSCSLSVSSLSLSSLSSALLDIFFWCQGILPQLRIYFYILAPSVAASSAMDVWFQILNHLKKKENKKVSFDDILTWSITTNLSQTSRVKEAEKIPNFPWEVIVQEYQ